MQTRYIIAKQLRAKPPMDYLLKVDSYMCDPLSQKVAIAANQNYYRFKFKSYSS